jgi:hypothetical protein
MLIQRYQSNTITILVVYKNLDNDNGRSVHTENLK